MRLLALLTFGVSALILAPMFSPSHAAVESWTSRCSGLSKLSIPGLKVIESRIVPAGVAPAARYEPPVQLPEHCLLRGSFGTRTGVGGRTFEIRFELRMPAWNGRFLFEGGGDMDGVDWPAYGSLFGWLSPNALERGFAVVRTNSGHDSPNDNSLDGTWALDQQARIDYGFHALDRVTVTAKQIVAAYYGRPAQRSYFIGCSNGGRQAMLVGQRYPTYFDGVVAGNAAFNVTRIAPRLVWNTGVLSRIAKPGIGAFTEADMTLVANAVVKRCDALDGLADGMIQDLAACRFDVAELRCKEQKTASCLSAEQVTTYRQIIEGPKDSQGRPYYQRIPYDSGAGPWSGPDAANPTAGGLFMETLRYHSMTPPNLKLDAREVEFPAILEAVQGTAQINDAEATMLSTFASHGKLLIYHGSSDYGLSSFEIAHWYDQVKAANGPRTQDWARLFLVPGMQHCSGGHATDDFDPLIAIQNWVEKGEAPDRIIATGKTLPGVSRPLCPWPKVARYTGGDPNNADSFRCQ